jgi:hypothetical protein
MRAWWAGGRVIKLVVNRGQSFRGKTRGATDENAGLRSARVSCETTYEGAVCGGGAGSAIEAHRCVGCAAPT